MKKNPSIPILVQNDPTLKPFTEAIKLRIKNYKKRRKLIKGAFDNLESFAQAYRYLGFNYDAEKKGWWYREWAPAAKGLWLTGDFNHWGRYTHPLRRNEMGYWELFLSDQYYADKLKHLSKYKVHVHTTKGAIDRLPAYTRYVVQDAKTKDFAACFWQPDETFEWTDEDFEIPEQALIYECHVGMSSEEPFVNTYRNFADNVLPHIHKLGYNCIQLMAVQEHPYYGSFGYHVSNFFAPSSRFGTPDDLKYLINKAHSMQIAVIMDIVHSHAVKNYAEGLNDFDGSDNQYFHKGERGYHKLWDSKLFDYGNPEVIRFLLSNVRYWLEEFHFDGFRFDGVTSMMYLHQGNTSFDSYEAYFGDTVDKDAIMYLQFANQLIHKLKPKAISIAEDVSGMPGLCRPVSEGGIGFDYRLAMGLPDFWINLIKKPERSWNIGHMWHVLNNRRVNEKHIAYAESHDQALVGDKTLAFRLMDRYMYKDMNIGSKNEIIDRGMALLKLIRLLTISIGGEAYLNFMGNEFGHPEWIDFPREGNNWSYQYARRQWSLAQSPFLRYGRLMAFDQAMIHLFAQEKDFFDEGFAKVLFLDEYNKILTYERDDLVFVVNLNPQRSLVNYHFPVSKHGKYKILLCSDDETFDGHQRVDTEIRHLTANVRGQAVLSIYIPHQTGLVLKKIG